MRCDGDGTTADDFAGLGTKAVLFRFRRRSKATASYTSSAKIGLHAHCGADASTGFDVYVSISVHDARSPPIVKNFSGTSI